MAEDLREDPGEFYPGGTVVPGVPVVPGGGGGSSVIVDDTLTQDGENPVKSKGIWSAIWGAIAAPAASVYEWVTTELKKKQDKLKQGDNIKIFEDGTISASGGSVDVVAEIKGKTIEPSKVIVTQGDNYTHISASAEPFSWRFENPSVSKSCNITSGVTRLGIVLLSSEEDYHHSYARYGCEEFSVSRSNIDKGTSHGFKLDVEKGTVNYSGSDGDVENTIVNMVNAMPRYRFVDAEIADGVLTIAPYTNAKIASDGTAFTVAVGEGSGYMRDCVLRVECGESAPKITWGTNFHPRTDAETDFACEVGKRNVYWITEHATGEFTVAGWQETAGGNAE